MNQLDRSKFLGASDVSAILGLNPWTTPLQLWGEKTGLIPQKDLSDNPSCEWGKRLEKVISQKFAEKNGVKLIAYKKRFVHPEHEFLSCELDNIIAGTDEIVEIKTCNASAYKEWKDQDQIPQHYIIQVMMQLGLSNRKVGHIAVLIGGQRYMEKKVLFDQGMYDNLVAHCVSFWKMVQDRVQPEAVAADNEETMLELYPKSGDALALIEEMNSAIANLQELKMHMKELDSQKDEIEAKLKQVIGDKAGLKTSRYIVKWLSQESRRVDTDAVKQAGLFDRFSKVSSSRVLRITNNKEN